MPQFLGSSTPLTASGGATPTYTSQWVLSDLWLSICGSVFADQAGTIFIEQSGDGVHADISASYPVVASTGSGFTESLLLPYVRVRMTNTAGSNQTVLRLNTRFISGNGPV